MGDGGGGYVVNIMSEESTLSCRVEDLCRSVGLLLNGSNDWAHGYGSHSTGVGLSEVFHDEG